MAYEYKTVLSEEIYSELNRRDEEEIKNLELAGFSKSYIDQMRFEIKFKLNYGYNSFNKISNDVLNILVYNKDFIHPNVLFRMVTRIVTIDRQEIWEYCNDNEEFEKEFGEKIMDCVIEEMESLYYFDKDEIFSRLVWAICNFLFLDTSYYGFSKVESDEIPPVQEATA